MEPLQAYALWSKEYDKNINLTRDLEAIALRKTLNKIDFKKCLEIGCGTGKNTEWLLGKADFVTAVDLSKEMLAIAHQKIQSDKVQFRVADVMKDWDFVNQTYDLVSFSLVLEHIEDLEPVFKKASDCLQTGGYVYIGELHPFKQYSGSKARFESSDGLQIVNCYNHHLTDFLLPAKKFNLLPVEIDEYFDGNDRNSIPRILSLLFKKKRN